VVRSAGAATRARLVALASTRFGPAPLDVETEEGRALERYRRVGLSSLAAIVMRVGTALAAVAIVPVLVRLLGTEAFGLWFTITSATAVVGFADLGISNGLVTLIAAASARGDDDAIASYVSSAFFTLALLGTALFAAFLLVSPHVDWAGLLNATGDHRAPVRPAVTALAAAICVSMPLGVAQRVHMAFQEGFLSSVYAGMGVLLGLALALVAAVVEAGLVVVVAATLAGPALVSLVNFAVLFGRRRPRLLPRLRSATAGTASTVVRSGGLFLVLGLAVAVGYESDLVVLSRVLGPEAVTAYAAPMRLFALMPMIAGYLITPLWPAYGDALARGDIGWARTTFRRSVIVAAILNIPAALVLVVIGQPLVERLVPGVSPSLPLLLTLGTWAVLSTINIPFAMFLNGAHVVRLQLACALLMATTNLPLSILLAREIGVTGPILATVITTSVFVLLPVGVFLRRYFARLAPS
jgi:O-antigen/teichoic acid export membrane protein